MLALLIPIVASLFGQFQQWECESRISNNIETLAREFELAARLGGGKRTITVDLGASGCGSIVVNKFAIEPMDQGDCIDICQTPHCRLIKAIYHRPPDEDFPQGQEEIVVPAVCIRMPANVQMHYVGNTTLDDNYLEPGVYTLVFEKKGLDVYVTDITGKQGS